MTAFRRRRRRFLRLTWVEDGTPACERSVNFRSPPIEENALSDDKRLARVVLREVAGLSSSTALTPPAVADRLSAEMLALWPM